MLCKLFLLLFIGIFIGTLADNVPPKEDLITILPVSSEFFYSYRVYENPFFIYVDFEKLADKKCEQQPKKDYCLCYYGPDAPSSLDILAKHLSKKEKELFEKEKETRREIRRSASISDGCGDLINFDTAKIYGFGTASKRDKKWKTLNGDYTGRKIAQQKVCVSVESHSELVDPYLTDPNAARVEWYDVTIKTSGGGLFEKAHMATVKRMKGSGRLQLQFNTKMAVLQPFGDITGDNEFFVIPQITPIHGFGKTEPKQVIEDTFVQILYEPCTNSKEADRKEVFLFSPNELENDEFNKLPPAVDSYIGSLLVKNGTSIYDMVEKDLTDVEDILYNEMLYHLNKKN